LPAGTVVYAAGDGADGVYFIEAGQVTVTVHQAGDRARRVQTLGGGTVVGEMGLYQATESATSAVTDRVTQLYRLSRRSLQKMEADDPALLAAFHQLMAGLLAQRLARADREIERLLG
jgi:SulP family sulfate permease